MYGGLGVGMLLLIHIQYTGYAGWNTVSWLDTDIGMAMENEMVFGFWFRLGSVRFGSVLVSVSETLATQRSTFDQPL